MKNILKKTISIFLLLFVAISFSACASIEATTQVNKDGSIQEIVYITLDPNKIIESSENIEDIKSDITATARQETQKIISGYQNDIDAKIWLLSDPTEIEFLQSIRNGLTNLESEWTDNTYAISLKFENVDVYNYYYDIDTNESIGYFYERHFFYTKRYYYSTTMYQDYFSLYNKLQTIYSLKYPNLINQNNKLLFTYNTDSSRLHSNADIIEKTAINNYRHTWEINDANIETRIMFYHNIANAGNCMLIGVGISLVISGIIIVAGAISKHITKKKNRT